MGFLDWFRRKRNTDNDWEAIGYETPISTSTQDVPDWVLRSYHRTRVHHDGVVYRLNGKHYRYKIEESGQGGGYHTFYRKKKK